MTVKELCDSAGFQAICLPDGDRDITGVYVCDLLSWVMGRAASGDAWITIMSNLNIVAVASLTDTSCIILAEGVTLEDGVMNAAMQRGVNILSSEQTIYSTSIMLSERI